MSKGPIEIIKNKENKGIYYYYVSTLRYGLYEFFIGIDPKKNRLLFFDKTNFDTPIGIITFVGVDNLVEINGIHKGISNMVAVQAYKAIMENEYPESLSLN